MKKKTNKKKEIKNIEKDVEKDVDTFKKHLDTNNILEQVFKNPNSDDTDVHKDKMVKEWLSKDNIETKTELNQQQIYAVTTLETLANDYNIKKLKDFIFNFKKNMLSKNRGSAKELVQILKGESYGTDTNIKRLGEFLK